MAFAHQTEPDSSSTELVPTETNSEDEMYNLDTYHVAYGWVAHQILQSSISHHLLCHIHDSGILHHASEVKSTGSSTLAQRSENIVEAASISTGSSWCCWGGPWLWSVGGDTSKSIVFASFETGVAWFQIKASLECRGGRFICPQRIVCMPKFQKVLEYGL
jgi:hypothetical protein